MSRRNTNFLFPEGEKVKLRLVCVLFEIARNQDDPALPTNRFSFPLPLKSVYRHYALGRYVNGQDLGHQTERYDFNIYETIFFLQGQRKDDREFLVNWGVLYNVSD